jgi:hypothetical protein
MKSYLKNNSNHTPKHSQSSPINSLSSDISSDICCMFWTSTAFLASVKKKKNGKLNTSLDTERILKGKYKLETP